MLDVEVLEDTVIIHVTGVLRIQVVYDRQSEKVFIDVYRDDELYAHHEYRYYDVAYWEQRGGG